MNEFYHAGQITQQSLFSDADYIDLQQLTLFDILPATSPTAETAPSRVCTKCGIEKPLTNFDLAPNGLHGRRADCKKCRLAQSRERRRNPKPKPVPPRLGYKFCTKCGIEKLVEDFHAHKRGFAGRDPHCKKCKNEEQSIRRQTPEYREYDKEKHRQNKPYYAAYYLETKDAYRERDRKWRKANPEKRREKNLRRKAYKLKTVAEEVDYKAIIERYGYWCYICNKSIDPSIDSKTTAGLTFDHFVPLQPRPGEPQGTHTEDNIRPAHHACNVRKGNIPFELLTDWQKRGI